MISVARVNVVQLDEAMTRLRDSGAFDADLLARLETFICTADDAMLHRMNPMVVASELGVTPSEATQLYLQCSKAGLFTLHWGLVCPHCGDVVQSVNALGKVSSHFECRICSVSVAADLDDCVAVTFNVADNIKQNMFSHPEQLSIDDYLGHHRFVHAGLTVDGGPYRSVFRPVVRVASFIEPRSMQEFAFEVAPGRLRLFDYQAEDGLSLDVAGNPTHTEQVLDIELGSGRLRASRHDLAPGPVRLRVKSDERRRPFTAYNFPTDWEMPTRVKQPMLTGRLLLNNATFRRLYDRDLLETAAGLTIKDLTFLFTDLKGSTQLYERVGDLRAFQLVNDHFQALATAISSHHGTVVKTIGDAVMATFLTPLDALQAAVAMLDAIAVFNRSLGREEIILKIGIHTGAAIAVTQNERLDYFGQTVNVAARVQGLANAAEICITEDVARAADVRPHMGIHRIVTERAHIKGISDQVQIYRLTPKAARRAA
ncbi:MAG: hypothetical protein RL011_1005 [Pseudomonadota bacterium]